MADSDSGTPASHASRHTKSLHGLKTATLLESGSHGDWYAYVTKHPDEKVVVLTEVGQLLDLSALKAKLSAGELHHKETPISEPRILKDNRDGFADALKDVFEGIRAQKWHQDRTAQDAKQWRSSEDQRFARSDAYGAYVGG